MDAGRSLIDTAFVLRAVNAVLHALSADTVVTLSSTRLWLEQTGFYKSSHGTRCYTLHLDIVALTNLQSALATNGLQAYQQ